MIHRVVLVALALSGAASALPSWWGTRGVNRVVDARTTGARHFNIGLFGDLGVSADERTGVLDGDVTEITNTEYDGTAYLVAGFGLGSALDLGIRTSYVVNQMKRDGDSAEISGDWEGDQGLSEARVSLKWNFNPSSRGFWFGLMPWAGFAVHDGGYSSFVENGDGFDGIWEHGQAMFQLRRPMINAGSFSYGANLLATMNLDPALFHVNVGYHMFNQSFQFTDARYDAAHQVTDTEDVDIEVEDAVLYTAAAIEYPVGSTTLFGEVEWRHFLDRNFQAGDGEDYDDCIQVSPGVRFNTDGLAIDVTGSFLLSSFDPEWSDLGHALFQAGGSPTTEDRANYAPFPEGYAPAFGLGVGLSYTGEFGRGPAVIGGRVYDAGTGENLAGTVSTSDPGTGSATAQADGMYSIETGYTGGLELTASYEGYLPMSRTMDIEAGESYQADFPLQRIQENGIVTGTVTDAATGDLLNATVAFGSTSVQTTDGAYSIEVPAGSRTLTASAAGYASESATVQVPSGGTAVQDFELDMVVDFENVYFDFDRDVLRADARAELDAIAQFLLGNPGVSVRITGNADAIGTDDYNQDLAQRRADAVRAYLISKGVSEARLSTVSYGEQEPAAPNDTEANRALNRRAEFIILGR
jgi:outer membrane protein OmpA-like peptidoglycan-associated protein